MLSCRVLRIPPVPTCWLGGYRRRLFDLFARFLKSRRFFFLDFLRVDAAGASRWLADAPSKPGFDPAKAAPWLGQRFGGWHIPQGGAVEAGRGEYGACVDVGQHFDAS